MDQFTLRTLPPRPIDGYKGTFGTVGVFAGSCGSTGEAHSRGARMIGAPALVAMGANRAGCGLVKIATPEPILDAVLTLAPFATGYPIATTDDDQIELDDAIAVFDLLASESDAIVLGPGLGLGTVVEGLVNHAIKPHTDRRLGALVIDADAITAMCQCMDLRSIMGADQRIPIVMTPHPGEAARILEALDLEGEPAGHDTQRARACSSIARALDAIIVLKGQHTVACSPHYQWMCTRGHPCLGTGGTGDVLSGMIGSLIAQLTTHRGHGGSSQMEIFNRVCIGVEAHARCGEHWAELHKSDGGLDPRDLGPMIADMMGQYQRAE